MFNCLLAALMCGLAVSVSLNDQQRIPPPEQVYVFGEGATPVPVWTPNSDRSAVPVWPATRYPGEEIRYPSESQRGRVLKRIPQPNIVGNMTRHLCLQRRYMHLRACYYALHPEYQSKLDFYTRTYMCKEWRLKEERERAQQSTQNTAHQSGVGNRAFSLLGQTTEQRSRKKRATFNSCSTSANAQSLAFIEATDMNGDPVELLCDINNQLFQTFYVKHCHPSPTLSTPAGLGCSAVEAVVDTAVYLDDGDNDITNDQVMVQRVKIPIDCALHHV